MIRFVSRYLICLAFLLVCSNGAFAQKFFNLTADDVRIDSVLPQFSYAMDLGDDYADSIYSVSIEYPEFIDMSAADVSKYKSITSAELPALPAIEKRVVVERKHGKLEVIFIPLVYRDGKYQILVSFMLNIQSKAKPRSVRRLLARASAAKSSRYAAHSVLASGKWAKIRVPSSGIYQLTSELASKAGFSDLSKVKIYGYGGNLQNEILAESDLIDNDDLKEVATCTVGGRRLFYAKGPVSWSSKTATTRTRNPYSDYGYYFLTQSDAEPLSVDSAAFVSSFYPSNDDYHSLHEIDNYAWLQGGRNLFENSPVSVGYSKTYTLSTPVQDTSGTVSVAVTSGVNSVTSIKFNGVALDNITTSILTDYDKGNEAVGKYSVSNLHANDTITITPVSGGPVRLDYISITYATPRPLPLLSKATFSVPEYVYNITNQDHHADAACDMVIIVPTSGKLTAQAERLKAFHETHDSLRVTIVPADELYNEFSSGTPDANAYRRYLKMLYDRAATDADMPKYLLLFGDCVWDNRMLTSDCSQLSPDDYLLCFESENSFNDVYCYVDDGFFCLLDDGEGGDPQSSDKLDVAVGRFPVHDASEAKIMVDKTISYAENANAGGWQNTIMFMGDDGNANLHMRDVNEVATDIESRYPGYLVKRVMWDAYTRVTSSVGNTYPEVSKIIKQQQAAGALIMDYAGHGNALQISHEAVLKIADFENFKNTNLPLWITASCDIMPFDGSGSTIGEAALLNKKGGTMAFFGTTRTVYANYNKVINGAYLRYVLGMTDGKSTTLGEAQRLAKNYLITSGGDQTTNKLQYSLLGDPALALNTPTLQVVIDSINGSNASSSTVASLKSGNVAKVKGHIVKNSAKATSFKGIVNATVRDTKELITCKRNDGTATAFTFYDRPKILFNGSDSVSNGEFSFSFAVPKDINYADGTGLMNLYAVSTDHQEKANGYNGNFSVAGSDALVNDSIGPSVYCYLNSPSFTNGGNVNTSPYFVAEVSDKDGINATGNGIGHDLELIIDGDMNKTYILNDNFVYDFGSYTTGSTFYSIPELTPGVHSLKFRAWDILNNSSTTQLDFNVVSGLQPNLFSVSCTKNPAYSSTTFIINHDRTGSNMDVELDIFDLSGRQLWKYTESDVPTSSTLTVDWDLTLDGGRRLQTGVYLYRVRVSSDGSSKTSLAKKLIVINNN